MYKCVYIFQKYIQIDKWLVGYIKKESSLPVIVWDPAYSIMGVVV